MTEDAGQAGRHRGTITVLVLLAAMMQTLDTTIVNVALPYVQGSLAASQDQIAVLPPTHGQGILPPTHGQGILPPTHGQGILPPTHGQGIAVLPPTNGRGAI